MKRSSITCFLLAALAWAVAPAARCGTEQGLAAPAGPRESASAEEAKAKKEPPREGPPRLLVLTDIGGDPDDQQSMVRLMLHACDFEIEGLIATASGTPGELGKDIVKPELIREIVEAYGKVRGNLLLHGSGYPTAEHLLERIKSGNPRRGVDNLGAGNDTEGSRWIISTADKPDSRPLDVVIWGGSTDLAQALWRVRNDRAPAQLAEFLGRLRVHAIGHQDDTGPWILENFPGLFYILSKAAEGKDMRESVYRGMYLGGDESLTSREWIDEHVREGHGPLGALYPPRTWTAPNPHSALKEGDTPSWFYFLESGLSDPEHPEWGSWGGRFQRKAGLLFVDASDDMSGQRHVRATVWRWRPRFQNQFQARMDWCVKPFAEANHEPVAVLNGDAGRKVLELRAAPGEKVALSAAGSRDPDGQEVSCRWWVYPEAGTYAGSVSLAGESSLEASLTVPQDAAGKTIHAILEITDRGHPPLTSCRRMVINVEAGEKGHSPGFFPGGEGPGLLK